MKIVLEDTTYYDIPELVKMFRTHKKTIYSWIQSKKLKVHKVGRRYLVSNDNLRRFIESK